MQLSVIITADQTLTSERARARPLEHVKLFILKAYFNIAKEQCYNSSDQDYISTDRPHYIQLEQPLTNIYPHYISPNVIAKPTMQPATKKKQDAKIIPNRNSSLMMRLLIHR